MAEEVSVKGSNTKRPDVVLYVNGIALGVLELKKSSVSVESGIRQNLDNQKKEFIRDFFKTIQLVMAGNESQGLRYGVIETKEKHYLSWKEEGVLKNLFETIECFLKKERFLEFIHDFLIFDKGQKKCAKFHQYFAIKKTQEFIKRKEGGIIWHTQGSGKSLTMVWLTRWLRRNIKQARILIVTDRRELDAQIQGVFEGIDEPIYRADSKKDLLGALFENKEFLVGALVHKFDEFDDNDLEDLKKQPVLKECVKNAPNLANKERLCQKEVHEKFSDPYSSSKELSVKSAISFCIKKVDAKLEKQSPFIDANKMAIQSAGLLRKNKDALIAFAADICMERNEHKKEEFISLKDSCTQSQAKLYNNKERFDKFIQDYQKDLKTCLLDTSNTKEEVEQNFSQCQKEQLRDDNKGLGFTLEELVKKYAK